MNKNNNNIKIYKRKGNTGGDRRITVKHPEYTYYGFTKIVRTTGLC